MKEIIIPIILSTISLLASGQNVGINSTGSTPNASAILDVDASNKGLLIPRVSLLTTADIGTISTPATSLLVYNTNATITGVGANGVGYYYFDGIKWIKLLANNTTSAGWLTTGNSGTIDGVNFIGTTSNVPLNFRINNNKAGRIDSTNANVFLGSLSGGDITAQNNTAIGHFALRFNTSGTNNVAVGKSTLGSLFSGNNNIAVGNNAIGVANTIENVAIGNNAMYQGYGSYNVALGSEVLSNFANGWYNVGIGYQALTRSNGSFNTATGYKSMFSNNNGQENTATGYNALINNSNGSLNVAVGSNALFNNSTSNYNTALGAYSMYSNSTGNDNTVIGYNALYTNSTGNKNVANGNNSMYSNTIGYSNSATGYNALYNNIQGWGNTANGESSLYSNTNSNLNTATGFSSLYKNTAATNTATGAYSLYNNTTGANNTANGEHSLYNNSTGFQNVACGVSSLNSISSGNNNTGIGYSADVTNGLTNATALGANAKAEQSNSLVLGSINGINGATANTNVGIGITTPNAPLQFSSSYANRKIALFDVFNNDHNFHGFGVSSEGLRYQIISNSFSHIFYAGTGIATSKELMRISGNGNVGINESNPTTAKLVISGTATQEGIDLSSSDQYANLRVIRNSLGSDKDMFIGFQSGSTSSLHFYSNNTESMIVKGNNVGIGLSTTPLAKLHVAGAFLADGEQTTHTQGAWLEWNKNSGDGRTYLLNQKGLGAGGFVIGEVDGANAISQRIVIDNAGNVGIGTTLPLLQKFTVIGNGTFSGTVNASCGILICSDIRYKKDIQPLQNSLSKVIQLSGVSYYFKKEDFKDKNFNDNKQVGLIAQEVEKIYPELVQSDIDGFKSIDYAKLTPILVEAIKELKQENDTLKEDNIQLRTLIKKLDTKIESIENSLNSILPIYQINK